MLMSNTPLNPLSQDCNSRSRCLINKISLHAALKMWAAEPNNDIRALEFNIFLSWKLYP